MELREIFGIDKAWWYPKEQYFLLKSSISCDSLSHFIICTKKSQQSSCCSSDPGVLCILPFPRPLCSGHMQNSTWQGISRWPGTYWSIPEGSLSTQLHRGSYGFTHLAPPGRNEKLLLFLHLFHQVSSWIIWKHLCGKFSFKFLSLIH